MKKGEQERRPQQLFKLERNHTSVSVWESSQHNNLGKKGEIEPWLRNQRAGFRPNRACVDQITSLCIRVGQSLEWNSPLYINFVYYEKAFESITRDTQWKLLIHYGIPNKLVSFIKNS